MTTATRPPISSALSTDRALPTVEIIRIPRPYLRGACMVRCSEGRLSGCFVSLAAARVYLASLVESGQAVAA